MHLLQQVNKLRSEITSGRFPYHLYQFSGSVLDWLYPPVCGGCDKPGSRWCPACQEATIPIADPVCRYCGEPAVSLCEDCKKQPPAYKMARSYSYFRGSLRKAIHRLKYKSDVSLGDPLSIPLIALLKTLNWPVDLIIPVPLSPKRLRERGYNQAALLARPTALALNIAYSPHALLRTRETHSQVGLSEAQRIVNLNGAFQASAKIVNGKKIVLFDDVMTTGTTMNSCAQTLLAAGALEVYALTLARTFHSAHIDTARPRQHPVDENIDVEDGVPINL